MSRATSARRYYVRGEASALGGNLPLDVAAVRDGLINNLNHLQDEMVQHAGNLAVPKNNATLLDYFDQSTTTVGTVAPLDYLCPVPTFLRMQSDGSSSRVVVSARVLVSAAATATFRFALTKLPNLGDTYASPSAPLPGSFPGVQSIDTTSTTGETVHCELYVARLTDGWLNRYPATSGDGVATTVDLYMGQVEVWATSTSSTAHPRLLSLTVREYVGT